MWNQRQTLLTERRMAQEAYRDALTWRERQYARLGQDVMNALRARGWAGVWVDQKTFALEAVGEAEARATDAGVKLKRATDALLRDIARQPSVKQF